ncbi:MAG: helix-turn-helix domain-containing protein [Moraxellaceae bacterium]|nr:helix-turn-helix domain-containing protein [Moraxellaceae bacterium]
MNAADLSKTLPSAYVLLLLDVTKRFGVSEEAILSPFGLTKSALLDTHEHLPLTLVNDVLIHALAVTKEPALPFHIGMQMKISTHGFIGFAAMTADNVRQALELVERFSELRLLGANIRLIVDGDNAKLLVDTDLTLQPLRDAVLAALMVGFGQMAQVVTGETLYGVAYIEIDEEPRYRDIMYHLPAQIHFKQAQNVICFDASYLDLPLLMSDTASMQLAVKQCEQELAAIGHFSPFIREVRALVHDSSVGFRSLEAVAEMLNQSERTLKRQLAQEGTTFSDILEDMRRQEAIRLLLNTGESLDRIAEALGYSDVANFNRAFKRWTGTTPGQYRREQNQSDK